MFFGMALLFGFWGAWAVIRNEDIKVLQNLGKSTHAKICKPLFELTAYRFVLFCFFFPQLIQVESRDTLNSIALKFDTTPNELVQLNKLFSRAVVPGQVLLHYICYLSNKVLFTVFLILTRVLKYFSYWFSYWLCKRVFPFSLVYYFLVPMK